MLVFRGRSQFRDMECIAYLYGLPIDNVKSHTNPGHIISSMLSDDEDVLHKRDCLIRHTNILLYVFSPYKLYLSYTADRLKKLHSAAAG